METTMVPRTHVRVPRSVAKGETVRVLAKIDHPMENGWGGAENGESRRRSLVRTFQCRFNDREVFRADLRAGISSDPYVTFFVRASESGTFRFTWIDDDDRRYERSAPMEVTG